MLLVKASMAGIEQSGARQAGALAKLGIKRL
jgi:hypothetical protein